MTRIVMVDDYSDSPFVKTNCFRHARVGELIAYGKFVDVHQNLGKQHERMSAKDIVIAENFCKSLDYYYSEDPIRFESLIGQRRVTPSGREYRFRILKEYLGSWGVSLHFIVLCEERSLLQSFLPPLMYSCSCIAKEWGVIRREFDVSVRRGGLTAEICLKGSCDNPKSIALALIY